MAVKVKLTRPELKRYRDQLQRYERYLPMLKLKQQQLQITVQEVHRRRERAADVVRQAEEVVRGYESVFADPAGVPFQQWSKPREVKLSRANVAGVWLPVFESVVFDTPSYGLFGTPAWVDQALVDLREISARRAELATLEEQYQLLTRALTRIVQRVNLFEKLKIPECQTAIRLIRIKLGDEMANAVGRAKIAKVKLAAGRHTSKGSSPGATGLKEESSSA